MKNKTYKRMQTGEFDFYYDDNEAGVPVSYNDNFKSTIMLALDYNLIEQGGAWYFLNKGTENEVKLQGLLKVIDYLRENPHYVEEYKKAILELEGKTK